MLVRWGILGRKKSNENINKIIKQNGGLVTEGTQDFFVEVGQQERSNLLFFVKHQEN